MSKLPTAADLLIAVGFLAGFFASLILVIGWSYAHSYFSTFGITFVGDGNSGFSGAYVAYALWTIHYYLIYIVLSLIFLYV